MAKTVQMMTLSHHHLPSEGTASGMLPGTYVHHSLFPSFFFFSRTSDGGGTAEASVWERGFGTEEEGSCSCEEDIDLLVSPFVPIVTGPPPPEPPAILQLIVLSPSRRGLVWREERLRKVVSILWGLLEMIDER